MIFTVWFRFRYFLQFLFTKDPVEQWLNMAFAETKNHYDQRIMQYESSILNLNKILDERNATIYDLQAELIKILRPQETQVDQSIEFPTSFGSGWAAQKSRLEDLNSRRRREEILSQVSKRESEIEEALNTPGADILSPVLDR